MELTTITTAIKYIQTSNIQTVTNIVKKRKLNETVDMNILTYIIFQSLPQLSAEFTSG